MKKLQSLNSNSQWCFRETDEKYTKAVLKNTIILLLFSCIFLATSKSGLRSTVSGVL